MGVIRAVFSPHFFLLRISLIKIFFAVFLPWNDFDFATGILKKSWKLMFDVNQ